MRTVLPLKSFSDKLDEKNFERDYLRISFLSSTVNKIDFVNTTEHNFVNIHPFWMIQGDLESAWHEESHHMNNGKMIPGQKVHIFTEPVLYFILYFILYSMLCTVICKLPSITPDDGLQHSSRIMTSAP